MKDKKTDNQIALRKYKEYLKEYWPEMTGEEDDTWYPNFPDWLNQQEEESRIPVGRPKSSVAVNCEKIKKLREEKGLFQKGVANVIGYTQGRIAQFETGYTGVPLDTLKQIAEIYEVDYKELLAGE